MDIWGLGLIFYELFTLRPLLPGTNDINQLYLICDTLLPFYNNNNNIHENNDNNNDNNNNNLDNDNEIRSSIRKKRRRMKPEDVYPDIIHLPDYGLSLIHI